MWKKLQSTSSGLCGIINSPKSFDAHLASLPKTLEIVSNLASRNTSDIPFSLTFCYSLSDLNFLAPIVAKNSTPTSIMWFAYPKKSSKLIKSDLSRDVFDLGSLGLEAVSAVAIDDDWSALRFKRVEHIKTITRKFAKTEEGKKMSETKVTKSGSSSGTARSATPSNRVGSRKRSAPTEQSSTEPLATRRRGSKST